MSHMSHILVPFLYECMRWPARKGSVLESKCAVLEQESPPLLAVSCLNVVCVHVLDAGAAAGPTPAQQPAPRRRLSPVSGSPPPAVGGSGGGGGVAAGRLWDGGCGWRPGVLLSVRIENISIILFNTTTQHALGFDLGFEKP